MGAILGLPPSTSSISSKISLRAAFFINESAYDVFLPEFKKIVENSALLLRLQKSLDYENEKRRDADVVVEKGPMLHFAFDIGVVPPLYLVAIKCRDRKLRCVALRLIEQN